MTLMGWLAHSQTSGRIGHVILGGSLIALAYGQSELAATHTRGHQQQRDDQEQWMNQERHVDQERYVYQEQRVNQEQHVTCHYRRPLLDLCLTSHYQPLHAAYHSCRYRRHPVVLGTYNRNRCINHGNQQRPLPARARNELLNHHQSRIATSPRTSSSRHHESTSKLTSLDGVVQYDDRRLQSNTRSHIQHDDLAPPPSKQVAVHNVYDSEDDDREEEVEDPVESSATSLKGSGIWHARK